MTTQLNTQTYSQINTEVTNLLKTGQYSGVNITIYVDAEGNVPATLNGNAVENRKIMKINSTASYKINKAKLSNHVLMFILLVMKYLNQLMKMILIIIK